MGRRQIEGDGGDNLLNGGAGEDEIRGRRGNDTLNGGGDDDRLRGDKGNDVLDGGSGNDRLRGDHGDDVLTGGTGSDRFIFNFQGGNDLVTDYDDAADRLDVSNFGFASAQDVIDNAVQDGADTVITLSELDGGVTVRLADTLVSELDAGDFII